MNITERALAHVCAVHKTSEKILICPTLASGHQLLESLGRQGVPWLNLTPVTPYELAAEAAAPVLQSRGITIADESRLLLVLEEILNELHTAGKLPYFARLQEHGTFARVLFPTLMELRQTGLNAGALDPASFVDPQKGREIQATLSAWEDRLQHENIADPATVYSTALTAAKTKRRPHYIIPEGLELPLLAHRFLTGITADNLTVLPADPVKNLALPQTLTFKSKEEEGESTLSWLYQPEAAPSAPDLSIFRAYGAANEVKAVLRYLKENALPLDHTLVCVTNSGRYIPLFYTVTGECNIPATFADGIPAAFTRPGRLALHILRWLEEKYASRELYRLLTSGDAQIPRAHGLARLLREAGVGWDRNRYLPCLDTLAATLAKKEETVRRDDNATYAEILAFRQEQVGTLRELLGLIFSHLPATDSDGTVDFPALCRGLAELVAALARTTSELEGSAQAAVREALNEAATSYSGRLPQNPATFRLRQLLETLRIGASPPKPGHIHISGLTQAMWTRRPLTFVVGLDSHNFPGAGLQDPILLDVERSRIHSALTQKSMEPAKKQYRLARTLASCRGRLVLSYPCHDTVEGRPSSPAAILLQAYRLQSQNPTAGYSDLHAALDDPAGFIPEPDAALTTTEWWLAAARQNAYAHGIEAVMDCFPGLAAGLLAEYHRENPDFTPYDGRVEADPQRDPRQNPALTLSATQFEALANCPYAYYLRYVLRIEPPEETEYDAGAWLDPLTRGSLLHDIYCRYLREVHNQGHPPDRDRLFAIAHELIEETRQAVPPPSDLVFEYEKEELFLGLDVFFRAEAEAPSRPAWFEVPFGFGPEEAEQAGLGLAEPVTLPLPDGSEIRLRGRIDRIDYGSEDHLYQVWDYKTGKPYGYDHNQNMKQGRQIQHALYAYAAQTILHKTGRDPNAEIEVSGYLFPTDRGEGQRFGRPASGRDCLFDILKKGLDLTARGLFCSAEDAGRCTFCDYTVVCRQARAVARAKEKNQHPDLEGWREMQDVD